MVELDPYEGSRTRVRWKPSDAANDSFHQQTLLLARTGEGADDRYDAALGNGKVGSHQTGQLPAVTAFESTLGRKSRSFRGWRPGVVFNRHR